MDASLPVAFKQQQAGEPTAQTTTGTVCDALFQQIGEASLWLRLQDE